ncbi:hypothetical protein VPH35_069955 [Triticum aestivum]
MEVVASPSRSVHRWIHAGVLQGSAYGGCRPSHLDPSAVGSTAEQPRSAALSATPRPVKASAKADKVRRKAKGLAKQRENLRARLASRKRGGASSPPCRPRPPSANSCPPCYRTPARTPGSLLQKRKVISGTHLE